MADEERTLSVGRLRKPRAGRVELEDGTVHDVLQSRGKHYQALKALDPRSAMDGTYALVADLVPSMSKEQVQELTLEQANAIIGVAGLGVAAVEALYPPNVASPETSSSISPG